MPATVADWPQVKVTAIHTGSLKEAAQAHGIEYAAVRMRASREEWPVGRRVHKTAQAAQQMAESQIIKASGGRVASVTSAAEAAVNILADDSRETRISLSKSFRRLAKDAEKAPLEQAGDVLQVAKGTALVHNWQTSGPATGQAMVINISVLSASPDQSSVVHEMPEPDPLDDY